MTETLHTPTPAAGAAPASREKLIEAAARVYASAGFRGATTRRIAEEAGVNEVTLFRLFGSKAALIEAAVRHHAGVAAERVVTLPATPQDPQAELTAWCEHHLASLRARRALFRQTVGEMAERPEIVPCATEAPIHAAAELKRYMIALAEGGRLEGPRRDGRDEEAHAAGAMLMASLLGDAMGRDLMPEMYPQPAERAAGLYVGLFLRAIRLVPRG